MKTYDIVVMLMVSASFAGMIFSFIRMHELRTNLLTMLTLFTELHKVCKGLSDQAVSTNKVLENDQKILDAYQKVLADHEVIISQLEKKCSLIIDASSKSDTVQENSTEESPAV